MKELLARADARFSDLTAAERILVAAVAGRTVADCGAAGVEPDGNGRKLAWGPDRSIRAELLRWLCVDREAAAWVDLKGITISGARIVGRLDLAYASLHFPLMILRSLICEGIALEHAESRLISLDGSHCGPITAHSLSVRGGVSLSNGFRARGMVDFSGAAISDNLECRGGRFLNRGGIALSAAHASVGGSVLMDCGFRAIGQVILRGAAIGDDLDCNGAMFLNRGRVALVASGVTIGGSATLGEALRTNGMIDLQRATVGADLSFRRAVFFGDQAAGADLSRVSVGGRLIWTGIGKTPQMTLDLSDAELGQLADEEASWPAPDHLNIDGCAYRAIASGSTHLNARLRMLGQIEPFSPQPYTQFGEALRRQGRELDAIRVFIAREELRKRNEDMSKMGRLASWLFGVATGHGYKAYRVMYVPAFFVLAGWLLFSMGYRQGVVMPSSEQVFNEFKLNRTLPESYPAFNPLIYSLDTFLPLTDFHQEDYWYPNPNRACRSFAQRVPCGSMLHWYLGVHILAGWVFAILGLAGLLAKPSG